MASIPVYGFDNDQETRFFCHLFVALEILDGSFFAKLKTWFFRRQSAWHLMPQWCKVFNRLLD
jgi:hypothetical protein